MPPTMEAVAKIHPGGPFFSKKVSPAPFLTASELNRAGLMVGCLLACVLLSLLPPAIAHGASGMDPQQMSDMSDYDPGKVVPPQGPTVKIGLVSVFFGPGGANGQALWLEANWVAHDVNKRGGILIDGRKRLIEFVPGDSRMSPAETRRVCEKLILHDGCRIIMGTNGSQNAAVMAQVAKKHKVIYVNTGANSDFLMDADHFNRYTFMTAQRNSAIAQAGAYYCSKHRQEKKFYILCQDYSFGHDIAGQFKAALRKYDPAATIVGEDYHPILEKELAPYITKIKASGAEIIFTGDWIPDGANLLKTCRDMGVDIPLLNPYLNDHNTLAAVGVAGTRRIININSCSGTIQTPAEKMRYKIWTDLWQHRWKAPYNTLAYRYCGGGIAENISAIYWLVSVLERSGSLDAEKVIQVWEGDTIETPMGPWTMRADDHTRVGNLFVSELVPPARQKVSMTVPPYYWFRDACGQGAVVTVAPQYCEPVLDRRLRGRARMHQQGK